MLSEERLALLHDWQVLLGAAVIGVSLLLLLVGLLYSVKRRHEAEARWLRLALGLEFRQVAWYALNIHEEVLRLLPPANPHQTGPTRTLRDLQRVLQFPEPVIYAHAGAGVGSLGKHATRVVSFYFNLWNLRDSVMNLWTSSALERQHVSVPTTQLLDVADSLLNLLETAAGLLPVLEGAGEPKPDEQFGRDLASSQERMNGLRQGLQSPSVMLQNPVVHKAIQSATPALIRRPAHR